MILNIILSQDYSDKMFDYKRLINNRLKLKRLDRIIIFLNYITFYYQNVFRLNLTDLFLYRGIIEDIQRN
jgi:hypothetical protein